LNRSFVLVGHDFHEQYDKDYYKSIRFSHFARGAKRAPNGD